MTLSALEHIQRACLGLPLEQALLCCKEMQLDMRVVYTGERQAQSGLTPRVIAVQADCLLVSWFMDGDPRTAEGGEG